jgi:hypothetical protein
LINHITCTSLFLFNSLPCFPKFHNRIIILRNIFNIFQFIIVILFRRNRIDRLIIRVQKFIKWKRFPFTSLLLTSMFLVLNFLQHLKLYIADIILFCKISVLSFGQSYFKFICLTLLLNLRVH